MTVLDYWHKGGGGVPYVDDIGHVANSKEEWANSDISSGLPFTGWREASYQSETQKQYVRPESKPSETDVGRTRGL
jgi:hypothetical protein